MNGLTAWRRALQLLALPTLRRPTSISARVRRDRRGVAWGGYARVRNTRPQTTERGIQVHRLAVPALIGRQEVLRELPSGPPPKRTAGSRLAACAAAC
jgi:hypothetical protein